MIFFCLWSKTGIRRDDWAGIASSIPGEGQDFSGESKVYRSFPPFPWWTKMRICSLSMSLTLSWTTSDTRRPAPYTVSKMALSQQIVNDREKSDNLRFAHN